MIQRVQSLFLLAVSLLMIIFLFVPIWKKESGTPTNNELAVNRKAELYAFNVVQKNTVTVPTATETIIAEQSTWYIGALAIVCAGVALFSIFRYNDRMSQIKLGLLNTVLICGILGLIFLGVKEGNKIMPENVKEDYQFGFFIPAIALLCNSLANRFIRKDEQLVKSSDRIR